MASTCLSLPTGPNFSGDNYDYWATKMKQFLMASDLWDLVENGFETEEQQNISKEILSKDAKALCVLQSAVSDKFFPHIMNAITAKEAWTILQQENESRKKYHSGEKFNISKESIVPEKFRKGNEKSYEPKFVSIGPQFWGRRDLLKMEEIKLQCASSLLNTIKPAKYGELMLGLEKEIPPRYVDGSKPMKWSDMASNIMLRDACFVLELLLSGLRAMVLGYSLSLEECKIVLSDLLVLDNQIPFDILQTLHCQLFDEIHDSIATLALNLFGYHDIPDRSLLSDDSKNASNFVELVHSYISMDLKDGQESNQLTLEIRDGIKPVRLDRCATILRAAGVNINLRDSEIILQGGFDFRIRFNCSSGTLDIPALYITETTEARWQNLIAWEHHKMEESGASKTFICKCTSAALFFNALICCESDVQLLKNEGIIVDRPDMSNKDLVTFFRSIICGIDQDKIDPRYKIFHFDTLNKYHHSPINHYTQTPLRLWHYLTGPPREALRDFHDFLRRRYNYAAALITILSLLQTIYTVLSYHHHEQ